MKCDCKHIEPIFLQMIESEIGKFTSAATKERDELDTKLRAIATECGYEKVEREGWVQFPKQDKALQNLGTEYDIIQEHDDGDLTIRIPAHHALAVVTTEGDIFTKPE